MSNIGTTLRALGQAASAEKWWKRAIEARPTYFDAIENLCTFPCCVPNAVTSRLTEA